MSDTFNTTVTNWQGVDNELIIGSNNLIPSGAIANNLGYNIENSKYVRVYTDSEGKILWAIKVDGSIHYGAGIPPQVKDYVDSEIDKATPENYDQVIGFLNGLLGSDTTLKMMLDSMNEQIEGISRRMNYLNIAIDPNRGVLRVAGHMFKLIEYTGDADFEEDIDYTVFVDAVTTIENPEWQKAITDSEDKLLYGKHHDGTEYQPDLSGYTMTAGGVTASVNSIVNNLK